MNKLKQNKLLSAVLTVIVGVLFIIYKAQVISVAMTVVGAILIVMAIVDIINRDYPSAIVKGVLGVLVIALGWTFVSLALYVIGALFLLFGLLELFRVLQAKGYGKGKVRVLSFLQPILVVVAAAFLIFNQGGALTWAFVISGVFLIVNGALALVEILRS